MTGEALYLSDSYLKEWEAEVVSAQGKDGRVCVSNCNGRRDVSSSEGTKTQFIVLGRTAFYPNGGGQPWDEGTMTRLSDGRVFRVVFAGNFSGNISHEVEAGGYELKPGDKVKCALDWDRRYRLMRSHTAAHIISAIIHQETGAMISGNQLNTDKCRIDFSVPEFNRELLKSYEEKANEIIQQGLPVTLETRPREEVLKDPTMVKLAKGLEHLPPEIKTLRMVRIGDLDCQADGGTHVRSTKEVGRVKFIDFVNKGANNRRIYFVVEYES